MRLAIAFTLIALSPAVFAAVPDAVCWKTYNNIDAISGCQQEILGNLKKEQNAVYAKLEKSFSAPNQTLTKELIDHLDASQKSWLTYLKTECSMPSVDGPTSENDPDTLTCMNALTKQRTDYLKTLIK